MRVCLGEKKGGGKGEKHALKHAVPKWECYAQRGDKIAVYKDSAKKKNIFVQKKGDEKTFMYTGACTYTQ